MIPMELKCNLLSFHLLVCLIDVSKFYKNVDYIYCLQGLRGVDGLPGQPGAPGNVGNVGTPGYPGVPGLKVRLYIGKIYAIFIGMTSVCRMYSALNIFQMLIWLLW